MPRLLRRALATVPIALLALSSIPSATLATLPGPNGRIMFQRFDEDGFFQIWTANPDLSHQVQLTSGPANNGFATWSPDSSRIVFQSDRTDPDLGDGHEITDVFTMRADGGDVRRLTDGRGFSGHPSWSPDGRWIVFDADRADYVHSQGLYLIRSDGSGGLRRVTTLTATDGGWQELGRFSPDGRTILFDEFRAGQTLTRHWDGRSVADQGALFTVRPDGTNLKQLTPFGLHAGDADWSPDGRRIVFSAQPSHRGNIGDVLIANAHGSHLSELTQDPAATGATLHSAWYEESFNATWSPDGSRIVFVHVRFREQDGFEWGLQTMKPDGTGRAYLATPDGFEHQPEWGTNSPLP